MTRHDNPLLGTWHLLRWDIGYGDGRAPSLPYGAQASGIIVYTPDGWMSACIARGDRARLSSESVRSAPEAERLAAFESYFQYAGPYVIQTVDGQPHGGVGPSQTHERHRKRGRWSGGEDALRAGACGLPRSDFDAGRTRQNGLKFGP